MRTLALLVAAIISSSGGWQGKTINENAQPDSLISQPRKEKLILYEKSFKPSYYTTELFLFKKNDTSKTVGVNINQASFAPPETLQGYRIQLLSTSVYDDAVSMRNSVLISFPDIWIYTVYEAPTYKIRVGDFINRSDARVVLDTLTRKGFKDGWIVPDKIIKNQIPKPPLPSSIDTAAIRSEIQ